MTVTGLGHTSPLQQRQPKYWYRVEEDGVKEKNPLLYYLRTDDTPRKHWVLFLSKYGIFTEELDVQGTIKVSGPVTPVVINVDICHPDSIEVESDE